MVIIMFDRIAIKEAAKVHYKLHTTDCVIVAAIMAFLGGQLASGGFGSSFGSGFGQGLSDGASQGETVNGAYIIGIIIGFLFVFMFVFALSIAFSIFLSNVVSMGGNGWFLRSIRGNTGKTSEMFWGFKNGNYSGMVKLGGLRFLYITLWSMLFVIPGIIKKYEYSLADYIKTENPALDASKCLEISSRMTNGHKMDLFVLELSFFGWNFLSGMTCGILGIVYVFPYQRCAWAYAYEHIRTEAISSGRVFEEELGYYE